MNPAAYIRKFNRLDTNEISNAVSNAEVEAWMSQNVPQFSCPDAAVEETYYFRFWTYRKHIKKTEDGHVVTEFLPQVSWSGADNAISCPVAHHIHEGRWLADKVFLRDYIRHFALGRGSAQDIYCYQNGFLEAAANFCLTDTDTAFAKAVIPGLLKIYEGLKVKHATPYGVYWSDDDRDGMEYMLSGSGLRPTINGYLYGGAVAIAALCEKFGDAKTARRLTQEAQALREAVDRILWDEKDGFYKNVPAQKQTDTPDFAHADPDRNVLEQIGYVPFGYGMAGAERDVAFRYLMDEKHFYAPFGPTTADKSHPRYRTIDVHHECLWDGPSWPYATSQTLDAVIRLLKEGRDRYVTATDFYTLLHNYALSHTLNEGGVCRPWIDENLDAEDGTWLSRAILRDWCDEAGSPEAFKKTYRYDHDRGIYYNHSTFCDLVISGICGVSLVYADGATQLSLIPLAPKQWEFWSLENLALAGHTVAIRYTRDLGLTVAIDGGAPVSVQSGARIPL